MKRLLPLLFFAAALSVLISGCYSKATAYDARFTFAYAAGADFENFQKPIAPGAKLDVVVFANGTEDKLVITSARSSKPGVLAVEAVAERTLTLKGVAPGVADIEVTARDSGGKTIVDRVYLHVEQPTAHGISHSCTDQTEAIYVENADLWVYHALATSDGRPVIGYGYVPLRIEPASGLHLVAHPQGSSAYLYRAPQASPKITLRSTVDDSALSVRIVKQGDLNAATITCGDECSTVEGRSRYVFAHVSAGETPVCSQGALTKARSLTPAICSVSAKLDDHGTEANHEQLAVVTGIKFGICKFEITLPELDGGKGLRLTGEAKVGRLQFPGDGAGLPEAPVPAADHRALVQKAFSAWWLVGLGWLAPNLFIVACLLWKRRRARRRS